MGSPVVAIIGLVLGYTILRAGVKNVSISAAFQGQDTQAPTPAAAPSTSAGQSSTASPLVTNPGTTNPYRIAAQ
jgi:hypothetical protein